MTSAIEFTPSFKEAVETLDLLIGEHFPGPLAERWVGHDGRGGFLWLMRIEMSLLESDCGDDASR